MARTSAASIRWLLLVAAAVILPGCSQPDSRRIVTIWHQSRPAERELLQDEIARFEAVHPDLHVRALYKETEVLRSGF
jgi:ABC-type glycerol-3-phosphate transport system substrate-binding protein